MKELFVKYLFRDKQKNIHEDKNQYRFYPILFGQ